jgi:FkbM family methyltransferase
MFDRLEILKNKNYFPDTILDIGAFHGNWTNSMKKIYNNSKYYLFEAIDYNELQKFNNDDNVKIFNVILNNKICERNWYQMKNTGDSLFRENTNDFKNCEILKRETVDLNTIILKHNILEDSKNIFIKIDCQGAELNILKGSSLILPKTDFILLEIPLFGVYNEGVSNFLEHISYMDSVGFIPFDIIDNHYM